jgi:hypothetical protein
MTKLLTIYGIIIIGILATTMSCDRESSPEGRMSIKVESLQKEMMDKMEQQNKAILDSLGKIRQELDALKKAR